MEEIANRVLFKMDAFYLENLVDEIPKKIFIKFSMSKYSSIKIQFKLVN